MKVSKLKAIFSYLTGGVAGVIEYLLMLFNEQVLSHLTPESSAKYCADVRAVADCLNAITNNHATDISEPKRAALVATLNAVNELAAALADAKIEPAELDAIVDRIRDAIAAWKDAK